MVTDPEWVQSPVAPQLTEYYPSGAKRAGIPGRVVLSCDVAEEGTLSDCAAEEVYPANQGFAEAALRLAPYFRMRPLDKEGQPVGGRPIRITVGFRLPGLPLDALSSAVTCYGSLATLAERDPANAEDWYAVRFWAVQAMAMGASAQQRPSAIEHDLAAAHEAAATTIDTAPARQEIELCNRAMKSAAAR